MRSWRAAPVALMRHRVVAPACLAGLLCLFSAPAWAACESLYDRQLNEWQWSVFSEDRYTICYAPEYAGDTIVAAEWIDNAFRIALDKYGVVPPVQRQGHSLAITIFMVPRPTSRASSSTATVICCQDGASLEIHIMTPSSPDYGRPVDDFIKTLTHEMMNALHYEAREPPNRSPPLWILEGLAEYEGYFGTTPGNRAKVDWLIEYVYENLRGQHPLRPHAAGRRSPAPVYRQVLRLDRRADIPGRTVRSGSARATVRRIPRRAPADAVRDHRAAGLRGPPRVARPEVPGDRRRPRRRGLHAERGLHGAVLVHRQQRRDQL